MVIFVIAICLTHTHTSCFRNVTSSADCCDGTDERSGRCPATCQEAGTEYRAALKAKSTGMKLGIKAKEKYISKAVTMKKEWQQEVEKVRAEKASLQKGVESLKGAAPHIHAIKSNCKL